MAIVAIEEVCDYFIVKAADGGRFINLMKLHKLVYYGEAWWLAKMGESQTGAEFQAWIHGPVNLELSERFRDLEKSFYLSIARRDTRPGFDAGSLPLEVREHLDRVLEIYVSFSGNQLEEMVCSEEPWLAARGKCAPGLLSEKIIDQMIMKRYYSGVLKQNSGEIPAVDTDQFAR